MKKERIVWKTKVNKMKQEKEMKTEVKRHKKNYMTGTSSILKCIKYNGLKALIVNFFLEKWK